MPYTLFAYPMPLAQSLFPYSAGQLLTMTAQPKCLPLWEATFWPDSQFLLWDPSAWSVIHAEHMPQAVGLRCLKHLLP